MVGGVQVVSASAPDQETLDERKHAVNPLVGECWTTHATPPVPLSEIESEQLVLGYGKQLPTPVGKGLIYVRAGRYLPTIRYNVRVWSRTPWGLGDLRTTLAHILRTVPVRRYPLFS